MTDQSTYDVAVRPGQFEHSYARLPERCYARLAPTAVRHPRLVQFNSPLAEELGLDARKWTSETGVAVLAGNCQIPPDLVVDRWASDGKSSSHRPFLFRYDVWTMLHGQIREKITSALSIA
jgi:hypothetical protein